MKKFLVFCILMLLFLVVRSQHANNWYFGRRAGITFNANPPTALTNSDMGYQQGACASISDSAGNLLFYTNGDTVWNRNHQPMSNGTALRGMKMSMIIVPKPGSSKIYYLFTSINDEFFIQGYYCYSVIDMSLDGGLGDLIIKNRRFFSPSHEKVTATLHANGIDYWIVVKELNLYNTFRAYKLTCNGLNENSPVVSGPFSRMYSFNFTGQMKISPDCKTLIDAKIKWSSDPNDRRSGYDLFKFNNSTGRISNQLTIFVDDLYWVSGAEFSPDSKLLYIALAQKMLQYRIDVYDSSSIAGSMYRVYGDDSCLVLKLQLGPDGKIYVDATTNPSTVTSLSVINNPNVYGSGCNYSDRSLPLTGRIVGYALPSFCANHALDKSINFTYNRGVNCNDISFSGMCNYATISNSVYWKWDFDDGSQGDGQNITHVFADPTRNYDVTLSVGDYSVCGASFIRTKKVTIQRDSIKANFSYQRTECMTPSVSFQNISLPSLPNINMNHSWDFGNGVSSSGANPSVYYNNFGQYRVKLNLIPLNNCWLPSSVEKIINVKPIKEKVYAGNDTIIVRGSLLQLNGSGGHDCNWVPSADLSNPNTCNPVLSTNNLPNNCTFKLKATTPHGCIAYDSLNIKVFNYADIFVPTAFTPNNDGLNDALRPVCVGIKQLYFFTLYNRWGQIVFTTRNMNGGWNGTQKGSQQDGNTFVWFAKGITFDGRVIEKKGTLILIR